MNDRRRYLFDYNEDASARHHFRSWYNWATHTRLKPMISVAKKLKRRFGGIITCLEHPITDAISESMNSRIRGVKIHRVDFEIKELATAIYFHSAGPDLLPKST